MALRPAAGDVVPTRRGAGLELDVENEHYMDRWHLDESLWGALAVMPGFDLIVASAGAPIRPSSAGAVWYYNVTGGEITSETIEMAGPGADVGHGGAGDLELLCGPRGAPTLAPTPTPTPTPDAVYVPLALLERCPSVPLDVALVIDLSTSMREPTRDGRPKVEASLEAAHTFVELLALEPRGDADGDQAAVVGFHAAAWTEQRLSSDVAALHAALDRLATRTDRFTRLDLAVSEGAAAVLGEGRRPHARRVVVVLTDGRPSKVPLADDGTVETTVLEAAGRAKDEGVRIHTIGVGTPDDVDGQLLAAVASEPTGYVYAPDAEMLTQVYRQLAADVRCPPGRHDWSRPWP
jgi:Mg-chelatase subunit ChlD